jgi:23S rRNA (cytidine1920-2'-O)/16S rRNA (cytidine1409-2'-O)-methyltransferase
VTASPLPGPSGNVEFFVWFRRGAPPVDPAQVRAVVAAGPAGTVPSARPRKAGPEKAGPEKAGPEKAGPENAGPPPSDKEHP